MSEMTAGRGFVLIVAVSILMKFAIVMSTDPINPDAVRYFNSAHELFRGNLAKAFVHEKMLAYSFALGFFQLIFRDWALSGFMLSLAFLTLTLIPVYRFTRETFGERPAIWAALTFCLTPAINGLTGNVAKDAPFIFFMMMALWLGRKALVDNRTGCFLLTFSCAVLATLFRFEGVVFLCVYPLWLLAHAFSDSALRPAARRGLLFFAGLPAAGILLSLALLLGGVLPFEQISAVWQRFESHYFQFHLMDNYHAIYGQLKAVEKNFAGGQWTNDFFEIARYNIALIYLLGFIQVLAGAIFPGYLVPLFVGLKARKPMDVGMRLLGWMVVAYLIMDYSFLVTRNFLAERYVLIVVVMILPLVGHGLEQIWQWLCKSRSRGSIAAIFLILFICLPLYRTFAETRSEKPEIRLAGEWLRSNGKPGRASVIFTDERIAYYAGLWRGEYEVFPDVVGQDFAAIAEKAGCATMVLDFPAREVERPSAFARYELVKEFRGRKRAVLIFERKS